MVRVWVDARLTAVGQSGALIHDQPAQADVAARRDIGQDHGVSLFALTVRSINLSLLQLRRTMPHAPR